MHTDDSPQWLMTESWLDSLDTDRIGETRGQLLKQMAAGIHALQRAATTIGQLRGISVYDAEFADGRDGRDGRHVPRRQHSLRPRRLRRRAHRDR